MTNEEAIAELKEDIALYIPTNGTIEEVDRELPDGRLITALEMAVEALRKQKTGKWIFHKTFDNGRKNCNECIECSQCHVWLGHDCYAKTPYCPICGARMEAENADHD